MLPQCTHITRKRGVYYYRRRLPKPFSGEIAVSLRTKVFLQADWLSQRLDIAFTRVLQGMSENSRADIAAIATQYLRNALETDLLLRQRYATQPPLDGWDKWSRSLDAVELELDAAKDALAGRGSPRRFDPDGFIDWLMEQHQVPQDQRGELTLAILRADVLKWETIRKRALGEPGGFDELQLIEATGAPVGATGANALPAPAGPLLSEVLPKFLKFMSEREVWRGQTLAQNTATYDMFIECCGDRAVGSCERKDLAAFFDLLRGLPKLYSKSAQWKGLSLAEIVEQTKDQDHERRTLAARIQTLVPARAPLKATNKRARND